MSLAVEFKNIHKHFGKFVALDDVSLSIKDNEFFTLLGPSGCGKTTLLRIIAGFENPTAGTLSVHGKDMTGVPPYKRPINTVFQSYALFPHMTLRDNIAFPLKMLKWTPQRQSARVDEMLDMVSMSDFGSRYPEQLSGGQKQRIALVRALAPKPEVLLLDEPLSALDLKLRQKMREELRQIQQKSGVTFVFVTHDQEEALDMSDRICVLSNGCVQQIGSPRDIFENPANKFVADFIGETNFLDAKVVAVSDTVTTVETPIGTFTLPATHTATHIVKNQQGVVISLRPEKISVTDDSDTHTFNATVIHSSYMGGYSQYRVRLDNGIELCLSHRNRISNQETYALNSTITIGFKLSSIRVLGE